MSQGAPHKTPGEHEAWAAPAESTAASPEGSPIEGSPENQAPSESETGPTIEVERLQLPPYSGPKSHASSRAFAEMQERAAAEREAALHAQEREARRRKRMGLAIAAVLIGLLAVLAKLLT